MVILLVVVIYISECAVLCLVTQLCLPLCDPMDCSLPGSSVHGISQGRIPECVTISSSRGSSRYRDQTHVAASVALQAVSLPLRPQGSCVYTLLHEVALSCLTLCNTMDYSPPGSSVHEFSQTRILEWVAMLSSRGSSRPRDRTHVFCISCIGRHILYYHATWEAPV